MNEEFIRQVIRRKLNAADAISKCLPGNLSEQLQKTGRMIITSLYEEAEKRQQEKKESSTVHAVSID